MSALPYRVSELERDRESDRRAIERITERVAVHEEQISGAGGIVKAMEALGRKVDGLNKALYTFAAAFISAAIIIAVAVSGIK